MTTTHKPTAILCLLFVSATALIAPLQQARAASLFTSETLKKAMLDFYCQFPDQPADAGCKEGTPGATPAPKAVDPSEILDPRPAPKELTEAGKKIWALTTADQKIWALEIFDQILALNPDQFNETLKDFGDDYHAFPEHRAGLELLLSMLDVQRSAGVGGVNDHTADAVRERLREELYARRNESKATVVLDRAFNVLLLGYAVQGVFVGGPKGFRYWKSGGAGLSTLQRVRGSLMETFKSVEYIGAKPGVASSIKSAVRLNFKAAGLALARDRRIQLLTAGATLGLVELVLNTFKTYKVDPHHALDLKQELILEEAGTEAAYQRDELRAMIKESDAELKTHAKAYRERLTAVDLTVTKLTKEIGHLHEVATQFRPRMEPIAQDLAEIRQNTREIIRRLNEFEVEETWGMDVPLK